MIQTGVIHGRFQVLHNDHLKYLLAGKARCEHLVVGITNPDPGHTAEDAADPHRSQTATNPLTYYERYRIVNAVLLGQGIRPESFSIVPFPINFPELYRYYVPTEAVFFLSIYDAWGEKKLRMLQALGLKVDILSRRPLADKGLSSTAIRQKIRNREDWESDVPGEVVRMINELNLFERLAVLEA